MGSKPVDLSVYDFCEEKEVFPVTNYQNFKEITTLKEIKLKDTAKSTDITSAKHGEEVTSNTNLKVEEETEKKEQGILSVLEPKASLSTVDQSEDTESLERQFIEGPEEGNMKRMQEGADRDEDILDEESFKCDEMQIRRNAIVAKVKLESNTKHQTTPKRPLKKLKLVEEYGILPLDPSDNWPEGQCEEWVPCLPTPPGITPSLGILKRKMSPVSASSSPKTSKKRVSFLNPLVSKILIYSKNSDSIGKIQHANIPPESE